MCGMGLPRVGCVRVCNGNSKSGVCEWASKSEGGYGMSEGCGLARIRRCIYN